LLDPTEISESHEAGLDSQLRAGTSRLPAGVALLLIVVAEQLIVGVLDAICGRREVDALVLCRGPYEADPALQSIRTFG